MIKEKFYRKGDAMLKENPSRAYDSIVDIGVEVTSKRVAIALCASLDLVSLCWREH